MHRRTSGNRQHPVRATLSLTSCSDMIHKNSIVWAQSFCARGVSVSTTSAAKPSQASFAPSHKPRGARLRECSALRSSSTRQATRNIWPQLQANANMRLAQAEAWALLLPWQAQIPGVCKRFELNRKDNLQLGIHLEQPNAPAPSADPDRTQKNTV